MASASHSSRTRTTSTSNRVFSRPANLHLAWSASKEASTFRAHRRPSSSSQSHFSDTSFAASTPASLVAPPHPYSSFLPSTIDNDSHADSPPPSSASTNYSSHSYAFDAAASSSKTSLLKSGHLTWKNSLEKPSRRGVLSGFEKALRRRQVAKDRVTTKDPEVFVVLEQSHSAASKSDNTASDRQPWNLQSFPSVPFLASPDACDPSAFEADSLLSHKPRPVPPCLADQSRWIPPTSWAVPPASSSHDRGSQSRSSASSTTESLQTARSSPPSSPKEGEIHLNIHAQDSVKLRSTSRRNLQMRLRITRSSTIEMQPCPSETDTLDEPVQIRHKQLVITGEATKLSRPQDLHLTASPKSTHSIDSQDRRPTNAVCILSSANVTELSEWLHSIEEAIDQCRGAYREQFERRRSSASMLDTIRLFEQLQTRTCDEWCMDDKEHLSTPVMSASDTPPSLGLSARDFASPHDPRTGSDFSTSAFIDYYTSKPNSALTTSTSTPYSFEDAYLSNIRRFTDHEPVSPLASLPTAPLDGFARHARSDQLDVPVSPCAFDFAAEQGEEVPSSPIDPWLGQRGAMSTKSFESGSYAEETVRQIFAEGFRCR